MVSPDNDLKVQPMNPILLAADLVAVSVLMLVLYLPRRGRRELVSSFLVTNVGVLAVATAMSTGTINAGLGLGLFGVLSIIRLRSEELSHREIAYYFASLSLGLLGGLGSVPTAWGVGLMALVLAAVAVGDHPRVTDHTRTVELIIDQAITAPDTLMTRASGLVGGKIVDLAVRRVDLVDDTTTVQVRYRPQDAPTPTPDHVPSEPAMRRANHEKSR